MEIKKTIAKSISFDRSTRKLSDVMYIVIHYTGNRGDTAKNNADYFAVSNTRQAGAHFFVDKQGEIYQSVEINHAAWAVGGKYSTTAGAGSYYGKCTNANSISIELCDCCKKASWNQMKATRQLVQYIQKKCPNATTIIRHWDVNGKECPGPMTGNNNGEWDNFYTFLTKGYQFRAEVVRKAAFRSSGKVTATNKIGTAKIGRTVKITKIVGNWGRLKGKNSKGKYRWIKLSKLNRI